jgi:SET domain-containing protein
MTVFELEKLFNSFDLELLYENRYAPSSLAEQNVRKTIYYLINRHEFRILEKKYTEDLSRKDFLSYLTIRKINDKTGYGVYAEKIIPESFLIGEYTGVVKYAEPGRTLPSGGYTTDYSWGFPKVKVFGRDLEIDAYKAGGILRFVNHSFTPNVKADHFQINGKWRIVFIAIKDIYPGEQITVNYGNEYWSGSDRIMEIF